MINYFRYSDYSVISLPSSVIYFGGFFGHQIGEWEAIGDENVEVIMYKNLEWNVLGNLVLPRYHHSSIKMGTIIYVFGGYREW